MGGAKMRAEPSWMVPELMIAGKPRKTRMKPMTRMRPRTVKAVCPAKVVPVRVGKSPKVASGAVKSTAARATKRDVEVSTIGTLRPLTGVLERVACKVGMCGTDGAVWAREMAGKMSDVDVDTTREFVEAVLGLNERLVDVGHDEVDRAILEMMLLEVGEMMIWPGEWCAPCDV